MSNEVKEQTVWKTYPSIDFLQVNQFGEIRTIDHYTERKDGRKYFVKGCMLKQCDNGYGYLQVHIRVNGKVTNLYVHRVVASCFLPNPDNLPEVNHKDNNPKNNNADNLEWCTRQHNITYREKYGVSAKEANRKNMKPLFAVNLKTLEVLRFESQSEAARQLGISPGNISNVLRGRYKQVGGYWFTEDESKITEEKIQEIKDSMYFLGGVFAVNLKTFKVLRFESQHEAARQLKVKQGNIQKVLKDQCKQTGGCWFCYADENAVGKIKVKFGSSVAEEAEKLQD